MYTLEHQVIVVFCKRSDLFRKQFKTVTLFKVEAVGDFLSIYKVNSKCADMRDKSCQLFLFTFFLSCVHLSYELENRSQIFRYMEQYLERINVIEQIPPSW